MKINNFDVLRVMGEREMDIRGFSLVDNLKSANIYGSNGQITILVNPETVMDILRNKPLIGMLIIADVEQFNSVKKELEEGQ